MSARRKKRRKSGKTNNNLAKKVFVLLFAFVFFLLITLRTRLWDATTKLALVVNRQDAVLVYIFDKGLEEITTITIPNSTQVEVSRQLGTWQLGSVWKLGQNEDLGGKLLAETITRHFKLPVFAWADGQAEGFIKGGPFSLVKAVIFPYQTNLLIGDRLKIGIFSLRVSEFARDEIDFSKSSFIKKTTLVGGEEGYVLSGKIPTKITSLFSDPQILEKQAKVAIVDATGSYGLAEEFGQLVEVMGAKVVAIKDREEEDFDCQVYSEDKKLSEKFTDAFDCESNVEVEEGNFDLVIKLGKKFWRRF